MDFQASLPPDVPLVGGQPLWLICLAGVVLMVVTWKMNNLYFNFVHRTWPALFRPRVLFALVMGMTVIAVGMVAVAVPEALNLIWANPNQATPDSKTGQ